MSTSIEDLSKQLDALSTEICRPNLDCELWTHKHIAEYLSVSPGYAQKRIVTVNGFPRAIRVAADTGGGKIGRRWIAKEVKAWALKQRESA